MGILQSLSGVSEDVAQQALAVLQKDQLDSLDDLRRCWANAESGQFRRLALSHDLKTKVAEYFESEAGITYGKMKAPPPQLCAPMGADVLKTRGGQMIGPFREF